MTELDADLCRRWSGANGAAMLAANVRIQTELAVAHSLKLIERSRELLQRSYYPCSYADVPIAT